MYNIRENLQTRYNLLNFRLKSIFLLKILSQSCVKVTQEKEERLLIFFFKILFVLTFNN